MKCKREHCPNEVSDSLQRRHQVYCSRSCAPFGGFGEGNAIRSTHRTEIYSTKRRGEVSRESGNGEQGRAPDGKQKWRFRKDIRPELRLSKGSESTTPIPKLSSSETTELKPSKSLSAVPSAALKPCKGLLLETMTSSTLEKSGENGMTETEKSTALTKKEDGAGEIPPTDSPVLPINFDEARSRSMNLIDDTARHLLDYMKSIGKDCEKSHILRDYRTINAVANLGRQVTQLAKVKLDAIKEARK